MENNKVYVVLGFRGVPGSRAEQVDKVRVATTVVAAKEIASKMEERGLRTETKGRILKRS